MMVNEKIPVLDQVKLGFKVKILKQGTDEEHVGIVDLIISEKDGIVINKSIIIVLKNIFISLFSLYIDFLFST